MQALSLPTTNISLPKISLTRNDDHPKGRHYRLNGTRDQYPSVSTTIDTFKDRGWWYGWKNRLTKELGSESLALKEMKRVGNVASSRGTAGHLLIENSLSNIPQEIPEYLKPWWNQVNQFLNKSVVSPIALEYQIYWSAVLDEDGNRCDGDHGKLCGFAGTLDCLATVNLTTLGLEGSSENMLLDWKFFEKPKDPKYMIGYGLQGAAYIAGLNLHDICDWNLNLNINKFLLVCSYPGGLQLQYFSPDDLRFYWGAFKKMIAAYHYDLPFNWKAFEKAAKKNYLGTELMLIS